MCVCVCVCVRERERERERKNEWEREREPLKTVYISDTGERVIAVGAGRRDGLVFGNVRW